MGQGLQYTACRQLATYESRGLHTEFVESLSNAVQHFSGAAFQRCSISAVQHFSGAAFQRCSISAVQHFSVPGLHAKQLTGQVGAGLGCGCFWGLSSADRWRL
jgi:hypothetical protein